MVLNLIQLRVVTQYGMRRELSSCDYQVFRLPEVKTEENFKPPYPKSGHSRLQEVPTISQTNSVWILKFWKTVRLQEVVAEGDSIVFPGMGTKKIKISILNNKDRIYYEMLYQLASGEGDNRKNKTESVIGFEPLTPCLEEIY